jgi:hypothetical protein
MKKIVDAWNTLSNAEKIEFLGITVLVLICTLFVIVIFSTVRSYDIDSYKERVYLLEQKQIVIDKRILDMAQKADRISDNMANNRLLIEQEIMRSNEQERWMEEWKKAPNLPKPRQVPPINR